MEHLFFNSTDLACKTPAGGVPAGQPFTLRLNVPVSYGFVQPHLVLTKDREQPVEYRMDFLEHAGQEDHFAITLTLDKPGLYFYYFDLHAWGRKVYRGMMEEGYPALDKEGPQWQLTVYHPDFVTPGPLKGGTFYQIFPDRFYEGDPNKPWPFPERVYRPKKDREPYFWPTEQGGLLNNDYFGGDLKGIMEKLPYLAKMNISIIYLNPIFEAHSNHRYNTADYLKVDPLLGTVEDFEALCKKAKKYGIRIILDGVFSHTGSDSVYFNREGRYGAGGAWRDPSSPYRKWFDFSHRYPCGYRSWWGFETLPEVNETDPSYQEFICGENGVIDTWMKRGAGGFRLDVADELPDAFIEKIRAAVKKHGSDKLLLGEVWEDATNKEAYSRRRTYLLGKGLDGVMNYPFRTAALDFVKGAPMEQVADQILSICDHYPAPALHSMMNFLSTHDTERAMTAIGDEPAAGRDRYWQSGRRIRGQAYEDAIRMVRLAYALIFTLPGIPSIYYGDEIAMQGYRDPFNRGYFNWNSTEERLRPMLANLAKLRRECDAFSTGRFELVQAQGDLLQFRRVGKTETAHIAINRGPHLQIINAFDGSAEVNPYGFTILVEENQKDRPGYFKIR